jgi:hypothetical protein
MNNQKITFSIRRDLKERLIEQGDRNNVTLTGMINLAIEQYLDSEILRRQMVAKFVAEQNLVKEVNE